MSALQLKQFKSYCHLHLPIEALKGVQVMLWKTFIILHEQLVFKFKVDRKQSQLINPNTPIFFKNTLAFLVESQVFLLLT